MTMPVVIHPNLTAAGPPADAAPLPVASIAGQATALAAYRQIVDGNVVAFGPLGVITPPGYNPSTHEWGLGYDAGPDRWILVRGGPGATNYVGNGLENVLPFIHSHPIDPGLAALAANNLAGLQNNVGLVGLPAATIGAVCAWLQAHNMIIGLVPGLAHIFPSNADVVSNYTMGAEPTPAGGRRDRRARPFPAVPVNWTGAGDEQVYPTCRVDANGWLSVNPADQPLIVRLGAATAQLHANATAPGNNTVGAALVQFAWAPLTLLAGGAVLWTGAIKVDLALAANAWLAAAVPPGTVTRAAAAMMTNGRA
jgi:hypothetical protein